MYRQPTCPEDGVFFVEALVSAARGGPVATLSVVAGPSGRLR